MIEPVPVDTVNRVVPQLIERGRYEPPSIGITIDPGANTLLQRAGRSGVLVLGANASIVNMYGQAELGPRISMGKSTIAEFREGDVGRPLPGVEIRIAGVDEPGRKGRVEVASPYRMLSYFNAAGGEESPPHGWWQTGDVGSLTANGNLHVDGRDAPDVNFLGSRIRLGQLANTVRAVPGVLDCRISAVDHPVYGQQPSIRILTETPDATAERRVRKALAADVGSSASAMVIKVIGVASLRDAEKL